MALVGVAASLMFATSCTKKEAENSEESAPPVAINSAADFAGESVSSSQKESLVNNPWKVFPTLPGSGAVDIGVGANGVVWVIGGLAETGGYGIYYWSSIGWYKVAGAALSIDVDANGNPWIVNNQKEVFKRSNGQKLLGLERLEISQWDMMELFTLLAICRVRMVLMK